MGAVLEHFAEHAPEAADIRWCSSSRSSAITGHFCDSSGDAYIDILSCKDFQAELRRRSGSRPSVRSTSIS
jgi:hypothetical protein